MLSYGHVNFAMSAKVHTNTEYEAADNCTKSNQSFNQ